MNRSNSVTDRQYVLPRRHSQTLSRLISSEGIDLGLPGFYKSKYEEDLVRMPTFKMHKNKSKSVSNEPNLINFRMETITFTDKEKIFTQNKKTKKKIKPTRPPLPSSVPPPKPPRIFAKSKSLLSAEYPYGYQRLSNESEAASPNDDVFYSPRENSINSNKFFSVSTSKSFEDEIFGTLDQGKKDPIKPPRKKHSDAIKREKTKSFKTPPIISSPISSPIALKSYPDLLPSVSHPMRQANPDILTDLLHSKDLNFPNTAYSHQMKSQTMRSYRIYSTPSSSGLTRKGSWLFSRFSRKTEFLVNSY